MNVDLLVTMANDIATFFDHEPDRSAATTSVATHLTRYWEPRMRRQIVDHYRAGGRGLNELAQAAVEQLAKS